MGDATVERIEAGDELSESADIVEANLEAMRGLFPEAFSEDGIDFDVLSQLLGDEIADGDEKYGLNWHGKKLARRIALTPSMGTLRPCPEESVNWGKTQNVMIEGDNLEVLKLLQKSYSNKVKLIYIDPPYNTGKDFVYKDDFRDNIKNYLDVTGQTDEEGKKLSTNVESSGRFHTDWLNMMYPRLKLARNLLREDGVIAISIDDNEVNHVIDLADSILGEENYLATLIWDKQHSQQQGIFKRYHEYIVVYAKSRDDVPGIRGGTGEIDAGALKKISAANPASDFAFPAGVRFDAPDGVELSGTFGESEKVTVAAGRLIARDGVTAEPVTLTAGWTQKNQMVSYFDDQETIDSKGQKVLEFYFGSTGKLRCRKERSSITPPSILPRYGMVSEQTAYLKALMGEAVFDTPKPVRMMSDFVDWFCDEGSICMDFFAGSGTLGEGAMVSSAGSGVQVRYVIVQLPELLEPGAAADFCTSLGVSPTISELTKERLRRAGAKTKSDHSDWDGDVGFRVFKLDTSNVRAWSPDRDEVEASLWDYQEHLADDRSEDDILYEVLLKLGLDLCVPIEKRDIGGAAVSSVGGGVLMTCLAESIPVDAIEALGTGIAGWLDELEPAGDTTAIFRDSAFENDVAKTNIAAILNQAGVASVRSI